MTEQTIQLSLNLIAPEVVDERDNCLQRLAQMLQSRRGVNRAHVDDGELCIHFDPNLLTLRSVQRLANDIGSQFNERYRHEQLPFVGLDAADTADVLEQQLDKLPGVLHASVNYASGLVNVAYDTTKTDRAAIEQLLHHFGARTLVDEDRDSHGHGGAPAFLPHWMQERWELLLVAAAGLFVLLGWFGERFFGLPPQAATALYLLAYLAAGYDLATHAVPALLKGKFDTDVLMLAAALGAALLGEFFEGAFLLFLFGLGHAGEQYALDRARNAVNKLGELMPATAQRKQGETVTEVAVEALRIGDVVIVRPGDRVPVDGEVMRGRSLVDQSPITGESVPVDKGPGDELFAGAINQDQALEVAVTRLAADNTLARVMQLVAEAQQQQSPTQRLAQRFTSRFVPLILLTVLLVIVLPPLFGWLSWQASFYRAMLLLVAASPCALAIGTPASVLAGIAQAARNGVLIKGGVHLENLGQLKVMAFDKTGTLTHGEFAVTDVLTAPGFDRAALLRVAAAVEQQSNHPLAEAIVRRARQEQIEPADDVAPLQNLPGRGIESAVGGVKVLIGNWQLFAERPDHPQDDAIRQQIDALEQQGRTTMAISIGNRFAGVLGLADSARPQARATLAALRRLGVEHLVMLTGDNEAVAERIGGEVGISDVRAGLLPEDKLTAIRELRSRYGAIAMTGDGVNDAPALATATVGIAMGGAGTAVALETADVALMGDDLSRLPFAVGLSRAGRRNILQNFAISLGVIGLLVVTAVFGVVDLKGAVILHEGSTLLVVANALRLLGYRLNSG